MSVSVADTNEAQADFTAVMNGGENFLARAQALSRLRDANRQHVEDLKLGMSAQDAHRAAARALQEAEEAHRKATETLAAAKADAEGVAKNAASEAAKAMAGVRSEADAIRKAAEDIRVQNEANATKMMAVARALEEQAKEKVRDLDDRTRAARMAEADAVRSRQENHDAAVEQAEAAAMYKNATDVLRAALVKAYEIVTVKVKK